MWRWQTSHRTNGWLCLYLNGETRWAQLNRLIVQTAPRTTIPSATTGAENTMVLKTPCAIDSMAGPTTTGSPKPVFFWLL